MDDGARLEVRVVGAGVLDHARLDRLGLDPGLGRVVDAAGEVAVRVDGGSGGEERQHLFS